MGSLSNVWHRCANTVSAALLAGFVVTASFTFFDKAPKEPHTGLAMKMLTPAVLKGEPVVVRASGVRHKMCVVFVARSFKDLTSGRVIHKETVPGGFTGLGAWEEDIEMKLPPDMGEGEYQLRVLQNNDCGDEVFPLQFPPVTFAIVSHR